MAIRSNRLELVRRRLSNCVRFRMGDSWCVGTGRDRKPDGDVALFDGTNAGFAHQHISLSRLALTQFSNNASGSPTLIDDSVKYTLMSGHADEHVCGVPGVIRQYLGSALGGTDNTGRVCRFSVNEGESDAHWEGAASPPSFVRLAARTVFWRPKDSANNLHDTANVTIENNTGTAKGLTGNNMTGLSLVDDAEGDEDDERFFRLSDDAILDTKGGGAPTRLRLGINADFSKFLGVVHPLLYGVQGSGTPGDPYRPVEGVVHVKIGGNSWNLQGYGHSEATGAPDNTSSDEDDYKRYRPSRMQSLLEAYRLDDRPVIADLYIGPEVSPTGQEVYDGSIAWAEQWESMLDGAGYPAEPVFVLHIGHLIDWLNDDDLETIRSRYADWAEAMTQVSLERKNVALVNWPEILGNRFYGADGTDDEASSAWLGENAPQFTVGSTTYTNGSGGDYNTSSDGDLHQAGTGHWNGYVEARLAAYLEKRETDLSMGGGGGRSRGRGRSRASDPTARYGKPATA